MARAPIGDFMHPTKPQMVSYAQNAEDVVLMRALSDVERGFYVDVGAWHPETDSVTKAFYDRGWCGVNVEPQPDHFRALREQRPRDTNLQLVVSDQPGLTTLWVPRHSALATCDFGMLDSEIPDYRDALAHQAQAERLNDIFKEHVGTREVHFLKVDVEGRERSVLVSLDLTEYRPFILVIEATSPVDNAPTWHQWEPMVLSNGYEFALFDGLNRFYLREESRDRMSRLAVPANCLDSYVSSRERAIRDRLEWCEGTQVRSSSEAFAGLRGDPMSTEGGMLTDGFAHVGVATHDMEATLRFYCDVLGCSRLGDEVFEIGEGGSVRQVSIGVGSGQYIVFMQAKGVSGIRQDHDTSINAALGVPAGMYHYALRVNGVEALEAVAETLAERGVEVSDITDLGIIKSVFFRDPNGLQLELSAIVRDFDETDIGRVTKAEVAKD